MLKTDLLKCLHREDQVNFRGFMRTLAHFRPIEDNEKSKDQNGPEPLNSRSNKLHCKKCEPSYRVNYFSFLFLVGLGCFFPLRKGGKGLEIFCTVISCGMIPSNAWFFFLNLLGSLSVQNVNNWAIGILEFGGIGWLLSNVYILCKRSQKCFKMVCIQNYFTFRSHIPYMNGLFFLFLQFFHII